MGSFCPIIKDECAEDYCQMWSRTYEECSFMLIGESLQSMRFAVNDDTDCIQVCVKEGAPNDN